MTKRRPGYRRSLILYARPTREVPLSDISTLAEEFDLNVSDLKMAFEDARMHYSLGLRRIETADNSRIRDAALDQLSKFNAVWEILGADERRNIFAHAELCGVKPDQEAFETAISLILGVAAPRIKAQPKVERLHKNAARDRVIDCFASFWRDHTRKNVTFSTPVERGSTKPGRGGEFVRRAVKLVCDLDLRANQLRDVLREKHPMGKTR